ncbi:hypothetical protein LCGC14_0950700 [marine sediment metagenome]|uniref:Histidine phosphatase family protein n=1 Tax=marine sediment metagenome TaxID=412755 RepID=A0A0F9P3H8_9ZZZZ|nr:hypothetical protein [archaeon]HEC40793.1 hypothetical protein [bacterium]
MQKNPNIDEVWNKGIWTQQPRDIIKNLKSFSSNSKIILILRHSQRNEPDINEKNANMELTVQGHRIAKKFGEMLPQNRTIRLFHSPVNRCKETAEQIHEGFKENGGESIYKGECDVLWGIGLDKQFFMSELAKFHSLEVFYRWVSGFYKTSQMPPLLPYVQRAAEILWNQVKYMPDNGIDIYISHDWHILTYRFGWFGLLADERWMGYLGGIGFTFEKNHILLSDYGELKAVDVPHWWKK